MAEVPVQRHFVFERVRWTACRQSKPPGIRFLSAFGEERVLRLDRSALPTDAQLASAPEKELQDWLGRSQRETWSRNG